MMIELQFVLAVASIGRTWAVVLGILALLVSIALLIASWTRWGQTKSLTKCVILAVLAHVWLLMYAYGTRVITPGMGGGSIGSISNEVFLDPSFFAEPVPEHIELPDMLEPTLDPPSPTESPEEEESNRESTVSESDARLASQNDGPIPPPLLPSAELESAIEPIIESTPQAVLPAALSSLTQSTGEESGTVNDLRDSVEPSSSTNDMVKLTTTGSSEHRVADPSVQTIDRRPVPMVYQNRDSNRRLNLAMQFGGDPDTEASVEASLRWLAVAQEADGRWDASSHGAGRETRTLGEDRGRTGSKADTGVTGLALLAFLGAGYTHHEGPYRNTVQNGIDYLLSEQMSSGDLSGRGQVGTERGIYYARMYCHGIALLALAEAYALTGDPRIMPSLQSGIDYSLQAQNSRTGGWRYLPREEDPGDLSQFGWQAMAIKSAESGGISIPKVTYQKMAQFLDLVKAGATGGLATYRPSFVPGQKSSPAMTAEALACRMLMQNRLNESAEAESRRQLLEQLPGSGEVNLYYWYYATLAMFQFQDAQWQVWNDALKRQLLSTQDFSSTELSGSWPPDCIWGGYGGRVYSTAMACMCFEVYYRYLPLYRNQDIQMGSVRPSGSLR